MEILRKKGEEQLAKQKGVVPIEQVTELSFTECHIPLEKLAPFTHLQKLSLVSLRPQLKCLNTFPFSSPIGQTLRKLNVSDNKITLLLPGTSNPDSSTPSTTLSFDLPVLEQLILSNNLLATLDAFAPFLASGCKNLQWLELEDNPIQVELLKADESNHNKYSLEVGSESSKPTIKGSVYRETIFSAIPSLCVLDGSNKEGEAMSEMDSDEESDGDFGEEDEELEELEEEVEESDSEVEGKPPRKAARTE